MSEKQQIVFDTLNRLAIKYNVINHTAVYTIEDMENLKIADINLIAKNLFLRDDKYKRLFLVVMQKDKKANLKALRQKLGSRPLSFAPEECLLNYLGLEKGAVTPFGVLNDTSCEVEVVFDKDIQRLGTVGVHPNENTATVFISFDDLVKVIKQHGNQVNIIEIE